MRDELLTTYALGTFHAYQSNFNCEQGKGLVKSRGRESQEDLGAEDKSRVIYGTPGTQSGRRIHERTVISPWLTSSELRHGMAAAGAVP